MSRAWGLLVLLFSMMPVPQQPARDLPRAVTAGSGTISGIIVSDESEPRPLRRARVFLSSPDVDIDRTMITDDRGAFAFTSLPSGRYTVGAAKEAYASVSYGARRPGAPGAAIDLRDKQSVSNLVLKLPRGAVITGTVFNVDGQPLPGMTVRVLRHTYRAGERRLVPFETRAQHSTDDRGIYRIYGLPAGDYAIAVSSRVASNEDLDLVLMTDEDVRQGLQELRQPGRRSGTVGDDMASATLEFEPPRVGYAPVFYPGTTVASQASLIKLAAGEERRELDFQVQVVPVSTIRGTVTGGDRVLQRFTRVTLLPTGVAVLPAGRTEPRSAAVSGDGRFAFSNVAPGQYSIIATTGPMVGWWASADVVIEGQGEQEMLLSLQPTLSLAGRVTFDQMFDTPDPTRVRVSLEPVQPGSQVSIATPPAVPNATGRFSLSGMTAGAYRFVASVSGASAWILKSATVDGRDVTDVPFDFRARADSVVLTFTSLGSEVSGTARDASGRTLSGSAVVIFPEDRTRWQAGARRIRSSTSSTDGGFSFRNMPAGDYLLGVVQDIEQDEWFDRGFLDQLASGSVKLRLAEGQRHRQDLVVSEKQ